MEPRYPDITVQLSEQDGNAFAIIGRVTRLLRKYHVPDAEIKQYRDESMAGDYDNLLRVAMSWVNVE